MGVTYQAEGGQQQQEDTQCEEDDNQTDAYLGGNHLSESHQIGNLIRQTIDALLEPQYREDDIGEIGHLLDIEDLTDRQIDLDASTHTQRGAHFLDIRKI